MTERLGIVTQASLDDLRSRTKRVQVVFDGGSTPEGFTIPGAIRTTTEGPVVTAIVNIDSDTQLDGLGGRSDLRLNVFPLGLEEVFVALFGPAESSQLKEDLV